MGIRTKQWLHITSLDNTLLSSQHPFPYSSAHEPVPTIEQAWFQDKLKTLKISQRQLAKRIGLDPAAVSNMFAGKREMSMDEAKAIADVFLVPITEVMRQAGIEVLDDVRKVPIAGYIGAGAAITLLPNGTHDAVIAPPDVPAGSFALQLRLVQSPKDGWLYFVSGVQQPPVELLDRLCVMALKDGHLIKAICKRGYKSGLYNLVLTDGQNVLENKEVAWSAKVLWILPT